MTPGDLAILFTLFDRVFDPVIRQTRCMSMPNLESQAQALLGREHFLSHVPEPSKSTVFARIAQVRKNNCCRGINNDFSRPHVFLASVDVGCSHDAPPILWLIPRQTETLPPWPIG